MINYSNDEKIKKYLDELAEEYKELLYKELIESSKGFDELSISKLLHLDNEIKKPLIEKRNDRKNMLYRITLMGISYSVIGIFMYLLGETLKALRMN